MQIVIDESGRIVHASANGTRQLGRSRSELEGSMLVDLLAPYCQPAFVERQRALAADPASSETSIAGLLWAAPIDIQTAGPFVMKLERGQVDGRPYYFGSFYACDEPERGRLAAAAQVRLETMLEFAPAIIIAVSPRGTIDFINWVLPQYRRADVIGSSWLQYFPPDYHAFMAKKLTEVLASGALDTFEVTTAGPDGSALWYASQIGPIRDGGNIVGAVIVSQDITQHKRDQAELMAARRLAVLGTLASGVAHEINTPIQFARDSLQFLRDGGDDLLELVDSLAGICKSATSGMPPTQIEAAYKEAEIAADVPYLRENMPAAFDRCLDGLNRVATIVRSLREFAHPSGAEMQPADLTRAIMSTLEIARNEYRYLAEVDTDFAELPPVVCHVGEINQAVLNIVVNAAHAIADAGKPGLGRITVRTRRDGPDAIISISDTGTGIPPAVRERIFDPFFTTKEVGRGTGQGLAISWTVINEKHGGHLGFETEMGKGTTFHIRLPIAGKHAVPGTRAAA